MKIGECTAHFFKDSIGFIGKSQAIPDRTTKEKVCAIAILIFLTICTGGLFLGIQIARHCWLNRKVTPETQNIKLPISDDGKFTTFGYDLISNDLQSEDLFTQYSSFICRGSKLKTTRSYLDEYYKGFKDNIPLIAPRLNFSIDSKKDIEWVKLAIIYFGGQQPRNSEAGFLKLCMHQFKGYVKLLMQLEKPTSIILDIITILYKTALKTVDGGIADTFATSLERNLDLGGNTKDDVDVQNFMKVVNVIWFKRYSHYFPKT